MNPFKQTIDDLVKRRDRINNAIQALSELGDETEVAPLPPPPPDRMMETTGTRKINRTNSANYKLRQFIAQEMVGSHFVNLEIMRKVREIPEFSEVDSTKIAQVAASMHKAGELVLVGRSGKSPIWRLPDPKV
ncbi:MAG: hypothetical protein IT203_10980 [Fimbriimonadaceae bacterium]|nr:hypothetical protein [Fimbriimonadaceae bacterium]